MNLKNNQRNSSFHLMDQRSGSGHSSSDFRDEGALRFCSSCG